ncbi:MAG: DUF952 domain-containing protein [Beijerinckiaceae bacterium]|nr:DUF952 domain-containing protein [Beijerinckiaceae bacterium]
MTPIYKIATADQWRTAQASGRFEGAPVDLADGYIHFSTAEQARETAAKHFAGQEGLVLIALDADAFGEKMVWERSRGGQLFPHLYRPFLTTETLWARPLPTRADGSHDFDGLLP